MQKRSGKDSTLFFSKNFPRVISSFSTKKFEVTVGIGGNIGNVLNRFDKLFIALSKDSRFDIMKTSAILKNPPFGYEDQDDFYNGIIILRTDLTPFESLHAFQGYEKRFKRKRSFKDAPRTLDIDIIFISLRNKDLSLKSKKLTVPHPDWFKRESVIIPLEYVV